jgi:hypothetical protein
MLSRIGSPAEIFELKINYDRDAKDTNQTLAILGPSFSNVTQEEFREPNFSVVKFNYIIPPNANRSLCVTIPRNFKWTSEKIEGKIRDKLAPFITSGILDPTDFTIAIPVVSREKDLAGTSAYINFAKEVDMETVCVVRSFLHRGMWDSSSELRFFVFFSRSPIRRKNQEDLSDVQEEAPEES